MRETLERELKLGAEPGFRLPKLPGDPLDVRVFTSTYFDTDDHRLAAAGVTLRRRVERGRGVWQLKLPRDVARLELEAAGGPAGPPPEIRELLTAHIRRSELKPVAKLRTRRSGVRVRNGGSPVADVTLDLVAVMDDRRIARSFREIEAELVDGSEQALRRIEKTLRRAGAVDADGRPKVFQALDLDAAAEPDTLDREAPAEEHLRAMLRRQYTAIMAHDPGTRLGSDAEELHKMRVATRRLRAFLRAARPMLDLDWAESLRAELSWLGSALGPVRDLDVMTERLRADTADFEPRERRALRRLFDILETEHEADRRAMLEALRSDRYLALLDRLETAAESPRTVESEVTVRDIAAAEFKRLRKAVKRLPDEPSDEEFHAVRIRGKRARYAAELAEPTVGKPAASFIRDAKTFQDVLGEHQDAVVAEQRIRGVLAQAGGEVLSFAAGRLVERQRMRRMASRDAFPGVWKKLRKTGRAAWS